MIYLITILGLITFVYFGSIVWIIIGFSKIKEEGHKQIESNSENKISVIIPVRNEEHNIIDCLKSLQNQSFKIDDFEVKN